MAFVLVSALTACGLGGLSNPKPSIDMEDHSFRLSGVDITAKIPTEGWVTGWRLTMYFFYNVATQEDISVTTPYVSITIKPSTADFDKDLLEDGATQVTAIGTKVIDGIKMTGRTYNRAGLGYYTEYIGVLDGTHAVCIKVHNIDSQNDVVQAIINSLHFAVA